MKAFSILALSSSITILFLLKLDPTEGRQLRPDKRTTVECSSITDNPKLDDMCGQFCGTWNTTAEAYCVVEDADTVAIASCYCSEQDNPPPTEEVYDCLIDGCSDCDVDCCPDNGCARDHCCYPPAPAKSRDGPPPSCIAPSSCQSNEYITRNPSF